MLLTARTLDVKHVALNSGRLPLTLFDVPELLSRRKTKTNRGRNKRVLGRSIDERPEYVSAPRVFWRQVQYCV